MSTSCRKFAVVAMLGACAPVELVERASALSPDPRYEIRIAETELGANGHTKREVFVFGTRADGTYATDEVVVGIDRASAGMFTKTTLALGPLGATTFFTPCDHGTAGCTGVATLTLALASDPSTPIATREIQLVPPVHVSTLAPCAGPRSTMYLDGNDFIRNGMLRVIDWQTDFTNAAPAGGAMEVRVSQTPTKPTQGNNWVILIDSYQLMAPLAPDIYANAVDALSTTPGRPGLSVFGNGHGCNTVSGSFEIHELAVTDDKVDRLAVSFEQHCEESTTTLLEGCFRYVKP